MTGETFPTYEIELPAPTAVPPRSRLYPLAPIGVGTPLVENLTSYVTRLARAHGVTVEKLAATEIAPLVNKSAKTTQDEFSTRCHNLNGAADWAALTITALEALTLRTDLAALTLSPWRQVLSSLSLLRRYQVWCPLCYSHWRQTNQTIYNPLLWSLRLVHCCPQHHRLLWEHCPYPDCQKRLRLINSRVKLGYCPACRRWLGHDSASSQSGEAAPDEQQLWLADQLGRLLAAAPTLGTYPAQHIVALNLKRCLIATPPGTVQGLARKVGVSPSPLFGWMNRGARPRLTMLSRICAYLGLSLLDLLTPQPELDYGQLQQAWRDQQQAQLKIEPDALRHRVEQLLADPHWSPSSATQVAQALAVTPAVLKYHCPEQHQQILERNQAYQQAQRQLRQEKLNRALQAILEGDESPPPSMFEVARRLGINPRTARADCPELCRAISHKRQTFFESRAVRVEARLREILAADEQPPPSIRQVAARLGENLNYLYWRFPTFCHTVTQRYRRYQPLPTASASKTPPATRKARDHTQLRRQFTALLDAETPPPPSLAEVARQLGCGVTLLRTKHPDLCRQLSQRWTAYRQQRRTRVEDELRQMLATPELPLPPVRVVAARLGIEVTTLKQWLPELYAEVVRRHQAPRRAERRRRQRYLDQIVSENPAQAPSLSQVADHLGCGPSTLQRQFPEQSSLIVARYRAYREQEHAAAREALEAALANEQHPPLLPIQVARQLGYTNHYYVITFFPDLCHQLFQRYEAYRRQVMQAHLEAVLAEPSSKSPPTLGTISRQLGYTSASLKHFHPDLCQAIEARHQTYWAEKKRGIEACLVAILTGDRTPPLSLKGVGREFELPPDTIRRYFPELAAAVSARFKRYVRERAESRRLELDEEVTQITRQLFQAGIEPKLHRVISRLSVPGAAKAPHVRQAWQAARKELGLPT